MFSRFNERANTMFRRAEPTANRLFQSGRKLIGEISRGTGILGDVLGKVARVGSAVLDNNEVKAIASSNPTLQRGYDLAHRGTQYAGLGSNLSKQVSHFSDERSYGSGNHLDNIKDSIQRGKRIYNDAQVVQFV